MELERNVNFFLFRDLFAGLSRRQKHRYDVEVPRRNTQILELLKYLELDPVWCNQTESATIMNSIPNQNGIGLEQQVRVCRVRMFCHHCIYQ